MSWQGRMEDRLYDEWWGHEIDADGCWVDGTLHDLGGQRVADLISSTVDLFLRNGWAWKADGAPPEGSPVPPTGQYPAHLVQTVTVDLDRFKVMEPSIYKEVVPAASIRRGILLSPSALRSLITEIEWFRRWFGMQESEVGVSVPLPEKAEPK